MSLVYRVVQRSLLLGLESVSGAVTSSRAKRIMREIRQYNSDPHEYIDIYPSEERFDSTIVSVINIYYPCTVAQQR